VFLDIRETSDVCEGEVCELTVYFGCAPFERSCCECLFNINNKDEMIPKIL